MNVCYLNLTKFYNILDILADANIKPFLHPTRGFLVLFLKKNRTKANYWLSTPYTIQKNSILSQNE